LKEKWPILTNIIDDDWFKCNNYFSKTRLSLFNFCQVKYRKQYVEKILPYEETHATTIGTRYHEFMETFMKVAPNHLIETWKSFIHPSFTSEEIPMLEWTIDKMIEKFNRRDGDFGMLATEYKVIDHKDCLRGIIDYIGEGDDDNTIEVLEYKTSKKVKKEQLQMEFGFYDILLDCVGELEGYKRKYIVIDPRTREILSFTPSKKSTIFNKIDKINEAIASGKFKSTCGIDKRYGTPCYTTIFCSICSLEEIAANNGLTNYGVS
jgi:hypothetical protein